MDQRKIGSFIAARRKDNGLTQSQLAEKLGITDKAVSKWETGKSMPDLSLFVPLCDLLQITLNELLSGEFIADENLREKSDQILLEIVTNWLGQDQRKIKTVSGTPTVLKLKNVKKVYETESSSTVAVNDVSFEIAKGSFVGIMGASGSGKTTLLNLIATIDKAASGQIEIDGQDITLLSENDLASFRRDHLGFVFQEYNLLDTLTVYENIALALTIKQVPKETIKRTIVDLAKKLDISDILDKFPYEISGGQRQRCACVRAIAAKPVLILADEPTGALDSRSAKQLLETFVLLSREYDATILMVTHDALSASYCDRILFMQDGEIKIFIDREQEGKQDFFARILDVIAQMAGVFMMYLKLALRNAKRSIFDYLMYIFTMVILTSIICISNCIANWGEMRAGFQTVSLPLLIVIIMTVLANYINTFIVRQRAKEFATYMLLGMEKEKLSLMFLFELSLIGMVCFLLGAVLGAGIYFAYFCVLLQDEGSKLAVGIIAKSILQTFGYFLIVEVLSIISIKRKVYKMQIIRLMQEKRRGRPMRADGKTFWGFMFGISFGSYVLLLSGISFMPKEVMSAAISVIAIPMLLCVFSFYKWVYAFLTSVRLARMNYLYQGSLLYRIAELTTGTGISAGINTVFSSCLIFSTGSFVFGMLLMHKDISVFKQNGQQWMGFLQIGICIIFMTIYFSTLSLLQLIDSKRQRKNIRLLFYMGKKRSELKLLLCTQILVTLFFPMMMFVVVLWTAIPFVNHKVNSVLPLSMHNLMLKTACGFMLCFIVLYLCYFCVTCLISMRISRKAPDRHPIQ